MLSVPPLREWPRWARVGAKLLALLAAVAFIRLFVARGYLVTGDSMEPTLVPGDWVLVNRAAVGPQIHSLGWGVPGYSELRRFDLVVVRVGSAEDTDLVVAKRVVGMPGDVVSMADGVVQLDGRPLDEPHARPMEENIRRSSRAMEWQLEFLAPGVDRARYFPTLGNWGPLRIPRGHYLVLGDDRDHSIDSREFGLVAAVDVVGRVDRVLLSHDGSCCDPASLLGGVAWSRIYHDPGGGD